MTLSIAIRVKEEGAPSSLILSLVFDVKAIVKETYKLVRVRLVVLFPTIFLVFLELRAILYDSSSLPSIRRHSKLVC